jgi:hypothetical protein
MINLAIALVGGLLCGLLLGVWLSPVEAVIPGVVVAAGAYFFISRRTGKRIELILLAAQREMMAGRVEKAIQVIEGARPFAQWQFFVDRVLNSQLGSIHFLRKEYNKALPLLAKSDPRHWVARVMLAILHYRKKDYVKMDQEFETAARYSSKQGLLFCVWAWCLWKTDKTEQAMRVLARGDKELEGKDERLKHNLLNLQNGKKMKLRGYADQWYQFGLETPPELRAPRMQYRER